MRITIFTGIVLSLLVFVVGCESQPEREMFAQSLPSGGDARAEGEVVGPNDVVLGDQAELASYLAYAASHNPGLEGAFNRYRVAVENVVQAESLPDPRLSYRYYIREIETRVGAMRQGFSLAQTFPWLGKLELRGDAAAAVARAERQRFEAARLKLFYEVKHAYYEYYYLGRSTSVVRDNMQLVQHMEQVARTRYKASAVGHPDVIRAQVELAKLEDRLASLENLRQPQLALLNAALNRPLELPLPWPSEIEPTPLAVEGDELPAVLAESNPELQALQAEIDAADVRVELARKEYYPDVTLGVDHTGIADSLSARPPADDGKDAVAVMATINLPIWYDKLAAGVRQARHQRRVAGLALNQRSNELAARVAMVLYQYQDALRKLNLYRNTLLPKAAEAVKTAESAFRAGQASFTDLVDAQRVLLEFELAAERAALDGAQRSAELEMLVGRPLSSTAGPHGD